MTAVGTMDKKSVQRFIPRLHVMLNAIKYNDLFRDQSPFSPPPKEMFEVICELNILSEVLVSTRS